MLFLLVGGALAVVMAISVGALFELGPFRPAGAQFVDASDRAGSRAERAGDRPSDPSTAPSTSPPAAAIPTPPTKPQSPSASPSASKPGATRSPQPLPSATAQSAICEASFYSDDGSLTASGEIFRVNQFTAAHKTLPFNTRVRVTNLANGRSTVVRINDRGPFVAGRCIDLSPIAFRAIAQESAGVADVRVTLLGD